MPLSKGHDQLALARFLPRCLFVLFNQVSAYGTACDKRLNAVIIGDLDEAKEFKTNGGQESEDEDEDEANEEANEEDETGMNCRIFPRTNKFSKKNVTTFFFFLKVKRNEAATTRVAAVARPRTRTKTSRMSVSASSSRNTLSKWR